MITLTVRKDGHTWREHFGSERAAWERRDQLADLGFLVSIKGLPEVPVHDDGLPIAWEPGERVELRA